MATKRTYGNNYDELVGVRIPIKHRNILEARASARNSSLSEILREIIAVAVEAMEETQRSQPKPKPVEHKERKSETQQRVDEVLASKGFKEKPAKKRSPFRADGHHR